MTINDLIEMDAFILLNKSTNTAVEIKDVYICDLLSWVMAHGDNQCAWITVQTHVNIVAIAILLKMACIIIPEDIRPEEYTLKKADEENIPILSTSLSAYGVASLLNKMEYYR